MNIIEKIKEMFRKAKKGLAIGGTIATMGLTTGCGTDKEAKPIDNNIKIEQEKDFKQQIKYDIGTEKSEEIRNQTIEQNSIIEQANELESKEDVLNFLKNMYVEQYEKITGDTSLTTADIRMYYKTYLQSTYVNKETGEMIQYGENYKQVEQKLKDEGIAYNVGENVEVYKVKNKEGKVIDCVTLGDKDRKTVPFKVTMIEQQDESYISILTQMGTFIPYGLDYAQYIEKGNKNDIIISKRRFIKALKTFERDKANKKVIKKTNETEKTEEGWENLK